MLTRRYTGRYRPSAENGDEVLTKHYERVDLIFQSRQDARMKTAFDILVVGTRMGKVA